MRKGKCDFRCESLAFYRAVLASPKATFTEKLKACERIDKLLGLEVKLPSTPKAAMRGLAEALGFPIEEVRDQMRRALQDGDESPGQIGDAA